jgi:hypothetical protein
MPQSMNSYLMKTGIGAAVPNVVINPVLAWLVNRRMQPVSLIGDKGLASDTAATCIILSVIVAYFINMTVRRDLAAGNIAPQAGNSSLLSFLPRHWFGLGLVIGVASAVVMVTLAVFVFRVFGLGEIPFAAFALFKAIYTPVLAFLVARWVVLRHLMPGRATAVIPPVSSE